MRATGQSGMLPGLGRVWQQGGGGNSSGLHVRAEAPVGFPGGNGVSVEPRAGEDDGAGDEAWEMDSVEPRACRRRPRRARGSGRSPRPPWALDRARASQPWGRWVSLVPHSPRLSTAGAGLAWPQAFDECVYS